MPRILIVENITPEVRGGEINKWKQETEEAFGLAAFDDFDVVVGFTEDGEFPIIHDRSGMGAWEFEVVMAEGG